MATITERFGFTKPAGSDPASVVPLNSNTDLIEQYLGATQDMIAPLYDAIAGTYEEGDIVTYESKLYKALEDIDTPEAFDEDKWEETTAVSEGGGSGGAGVIEKTQIEYDALTPAQKTNGAIYMVQGSQELDDNYSYYSAENDTIIVRVYHEGESDQKIEWFFRGWNQTSGDMTVPSNLTAYLPSTPQIAIYSANYPNDTTPQNGWIGFYGGSIRAWTQDLANTMTGIMYGVVDIDGGADQTNPYIDDPHIYVEGSNKIYYMGIEYANTNGGSGGGGSSFVMDELYAGTSEVPESGSTVNLLKSIDNYDFIMFDIGQNTEHTNQFFTPDNLNDSTNKCILFSVGGYCDVYASTSTELTFGSRKSFSSRQLYGVYGIKFEGGGNSIPDAPTTDGTYILTATITNGEAVYSWEAQS